MSYTPTGVTAETYALHNGITVKEAVKLLNQAARAGILTRTVTGEKPIARWNVQV